MQSQSQQKGAGMCACLFYIPQKFRGSTGMCWQRQELTQVAQGREQVGLFAAESLAPFKLFFTHWKGSSEHICCAVFWDMLASPISSLFTFIHLKPKTWGWKGLWSKHLHYMDQTNPCSERLSNLHKVTQLDWRENLGRLGVSFFTAFVQPGSHVTLPCTTTESM